MRGAGNRRAAVAVPARIHPTALVGPRVKPGPRSEVGPYCLFEGRVTIGADCRFATGVALGGPPADRKYRGEETQVRIGSGNIFHEYTTVHRSSGEGTATVIGNDNLIMAYVHIAHNCHVGNGCVLTNGVQLGGHVEVGDGANIGGLTGVHQFCRIGALAMVGACSFVNKDIPPFLLAAGRPCRVRGVNTVGLKRAGMSGPVLSAIKQAFLAIYRRNLTLTRALATIEKELLPEVRPGAGREQLEQLAGFIRSSTRGIELRTGPEDDVIRE